MEIRFSLPNPDEVSIEHFIAQMKTTTKALEKSYQQAKENGYEDESLWLRYDFPTLFATEDYLAAKELKERLRDKGVNYDYVKDIVRQESQNINITLNN